MNSSLLKNIKTLFKDTFSAEPVIIASPGRINIIGEHTDYNEGFVLPAAIDKGIIAAIGKSEGPDCTAIAIDLKESYRFSLKEVVPVKNGGWRNYVLGVVAEIRNCGKEPGNFSLVFGGDIPSGSGLSSSAALENSLVFGLNELFDLGLSRQEMILISQKAEHHFVGVKCGIMDQFASMFGQKDKALLLDCRDLSSEAFPIDFGDYEILLINSNVKHQLNDSAYNERRAVCEKVAAILNKEALRDVTHEDLLAIEDRISQANLQKCSYVIEENERVLKAVEAIRNNDIKTLGELLFASHHGMQHLYKITCEELDFLVEKARENPYVAGARMMGGGFGGCTINLVKKDKLESYKKLISESYKQQFRKECSFYHVHLSDGTHMIQTTE
ncbi:galactokinase [Leptobacterium flavescens]|uniref:Galactokinase n=1 Tax=Leptobacterium flavescens TaxID=472055 RepID=A0A6P0ULK5_9FLAO|nr:galactokinase [Leptobacterium flavescens]NER12798.1 galactokinase [Leptobacterium flavescens]